MKILFFDIDGTLVGKSKIPSEKTCSAVTRLKENGHLVFLCTGRSKNYIAHLLNLGFDGYIANAGACVMYRNKLIYARQLDPKLVRKTEEIFDRYDIPYDHDGIMGVPITFMHKYNPDQFELLGITENNPKMREYWKDGALRYDRPYLKGQRKSPRLLIRNKHPKKL